MLHEHPCGPERHAKKPGLRPIGLSRPEQFGCGAFACLGVTHVDQFQTLEPGSPEFIEIVLEEAAWDWIAINGWAATPQLLFAIKQWISEVEAEHIRDSSALAYSEQVNNNGV